ncbi:hypothetical protein N7G274_008952 [Stereocaulon virgatum]|uniref:Cyclin N-terminal domain-containing protein n=1 Tax=Stereocaulon virgatum TaxID=373712 RepID=A0ABR4A4L6_9LECA
MVYYQQPCDSYFVESHDDRETRYRQQMRERESHTKRQMQLAIADDLSQQASYEYRSQIIKHMEMMESITLPDVAAIDIQTEIQWFMRPYLLDFLTEAHSAFGLLPETLFLTINVLDRYCSRRVVYKKHYQLVGCCALLIASKYGDRKDRVPTINELKAMCCGLYEDEMFTQMEWHVLVTVDWLIGHPTIDSFLQLALERVPYDPEVEHMACYVSEIAMFHKEFVSKRPSDIARTSLTVARYILGRPQAPNDEWASKYDHQTLLGLSQQLHQPSGVLSRKYSSAHLSKVSIIVESFMARQASISRCYAAPLTPPAEARLEDHKEQLLQDRLPATPTKPNFLPSINNGCLTPPITPTNQDYYGGHNAGTESFHRPLTPASIISHPSNQLHGPCSLPPISQIAPMF